MKEQILEELDLKLDKNNRIKIPTTINLNPNNILVSRYIINANKVIICTNETADKDIIEYKQKLKNLQKKLIITGKEKRKIERINIGKNHEYINSISKDRYLTLNNRIIKHLNIRDQVFIIIKNNHLELYPSKEYYIKNITKSKKK